MSSGLRYADAVKLLGGSTPAAKAVDNLLGGILSLATAGGSDAALSFFDAKAEMVRLGHVVTDKINESVRGLGRYNRSERLQAAHSVLVVTAFFEAFDAVAGPARLGDPELTRDDQVMLAAGTPAGAWLEALIHAEVPAPSPERSYADLRERLTGWYLELATHFATYLTGLAVWDRADQGLVTRIVEALPLAALARYEELQLRLAVDVPEFGLWLDRASQQALGRSLETLETVLLRATSGRDPERHRAALARAYRAELSRPTLSGAGGEVAMPTLGRAYVDPPFRVKAAGPEAHPADESWWDVVPRSDLSGFLAGYLTRPQACEAPLLLLGQPGAGKSALTRVLAARLPAADFLAVRVVLREVPAEAEIQDQIEIGLRATIGETVAWADLARSADGALPVILLDGFDELLQATGIHQSDYLARVAAFQQREATQGRPVVVLVTSRIAVADRARIPAGTLAVRLDALDKPHVARWLETWNAGRTAELTVETVWRFPDLAGQPLLLLMLALYDASGKALREGIDTAELYERLLTEFAAREVRRLHSGRPDSDLPDLIQAELDRLSVVALAMFHRLRQWVTEAELSADLAGLGLVPAGRAQTEAFRSPLTVGQEVVGRFFFIQRAQAEQDGRTLQTYEFLHATFGEYLVARLIVRTVLACAAVGRSAMPLLGRPRADDTSLRPLLGLTVLTARGTVLPFVAKLLGSGPARPWLIEVLQAAMTRPQPPTSAYRPVDKRIDHWMATYSLNLVLLALACGEPLHASEIFEHAADPAEWMRGAAQQWRAAVPSGMWLDVTATMTVHRTWTGPKRDLELRAGHDAEPEPVELPWARGTRPGSPADGGFRLEPALTSMHLSNNLSEDTLRHALQPMIDRMPSALQAVTLHEPGEATSAAHDLLDLLLTSTVARSRGDLRTAYARALDAVMATFSRTRDPSARDLFLEMVRRDAPRLPAVDVVSWTRQMVDVVSIDAALTTTVLECLAIMEGLPVRLVVFRREVAGIVAVVMPSLTSPQATTLQRFRAYVALRELGLEQVAEGQIGPWQALIDEPEVSAALATDRILRLRAEAVTDRRTA